MRGTRNNASGTLSYVATYIPPTMVRNVPASNAVCSAQPSPPCYDFDTMLSVEAGGVLNIFVAAAQGWYYNSTTSTDPNGVSYGVQMPFGRLVGRVASSGVVQQNPVNTTLPGNAYFNVGVYLNFQVTHSGRLTLAYDSPTNLGHFGSILLGLVYLFVRNTLWSRMSFELVWSLHVLISTLMCLFDCDAQATCVFRERRFTQFRVVGCLDHRADPFVVAPDSCALSRPSGTESSRRIVATTQIWTIRIVRTDDVLSTLSFTTGTLRPPFSPMVQSYVLSIPYGSTVPIQGTATRPNGARYSGGGRLPEQSFHSSKRHRDGL